MADKFCAEYAGGDFKSLLDVSEPPDVPWRAPAPNPREPEELLREREDQQTLQRMQEEEDETEASSIEEVVEVEMKEEEGTGAKEAEEEKAKQRALELYRLAEGSITSAASGSSAQQATYNTAEQNLAHEFGARWQDRGPRGSEAPAKWRGQHWRAGSGRYGNRGGDPERQKFFADQAKKRQAKDKGKGKAAEQGQTAGQKGKEKGKKMEQWQDGGKEGKGSGKGKG